MKEKNVPETAGLYSAVTHHTRDSLLRPGSFNLDLMVGRYWSVVRSSFTSTRSTMRPVIAGSFRVKNEI
jgi:hypothetical protein